MRRFLIILVLAWLPIQTSWAALSVYCGHETAPVAKVHTGHHEHQHQHVDVKADTDSASADVNGTHPDCAVCHAAASITAQGAAGWDGGASGAAPTPGAINAPASPPGQPERPKWLPA